MELLTQERLKELLEYNPDTGIFIWRKTRGGAHKGRVTGRHKCNGYLEIKIDYRLYRAHRLAWLYIYGKFPNNLIDHINCVTDDNRIANLREATNSQNQMNRKGFKNNKSGYKGVSFHKKANKWKAQISINNVNTYLGSFDNKEDAAEAYRKASALLHGDFAYSNVQSPDYT